MSGAASFAAKSTGDGRDEVPGGGTRLTLEGFSKSELPQPPDGAREVNGAVIRIGGDRASVLGVEEPPSPKAGDLPGWSPE